MFRYIIFFLVVSPPAFAEVCDRSVFPLTESKIADNPVREPRINFTYESGAIHHSNGARETVYCIRNDESVPLYFKWHGPRPDVLFENVAPGYGRRSQQTYKSYTFDTTTEPRTIEYGTSRRYGAKTDGETITFAYLAMSPQIIPVQAPSLDDVGLSPNVLADAKLLDSFLEAYRNAPDGGNELVMWSYASNWLPADSEVLASLAAGEEIDGYDGPYIAVSYGLRSEIDIDNRKATSSVRFWFGHFTASVEAFSLAQETGIRGGLSVVTAARPFEGLSNFEYEEKYQLSEAEPGLWQVVLEAAVGGGDTAEIVPWTVGLAFDGIPFSAMQAELFSN